MNKRIEQYTIIEASSTDILIDLVQDSIQNNGWQPLGGIYCMVDYQESKQVYKRTICQVMVKYELSA